MHYFCNHLLSLQSSVLSAIFEGVAQYTTFLVMLLLLLGFFHTIITDRDLLPDLEVTLVGGIYRSSAYYTVHTYISAKKSRTNSFRVARQYAYLIQVPQRFFAGRTLNLLP